MKTAFEIFRKHWKNHKTDRELLLSTEDQNMIEAAMEEHAEQQAIEFAKWIADLEASEEQSGHIYGLTLIDGNYYWEGDEDGDQPLSEEQLYKMFLEKK